MTGKQYALITGASSGIGQEFAKQLSGRGYSIIAIARREDRLNALKSQIGTDYVYYTCDLTDFEKSESIYEEIFSKYPVSLVVNNAGFGLCGEFENLDIYDEFNMIDVNIKAMQLLLKASVLYFKDMKKKGQILTVSSSASLFPAGPYMATYYATKSYVTSLVSAVAHENKDIYFGILCPGPVDTEFNAIAKVSFALKGISPKKCVSYALKKMDRKKQMIIPGAALKLAAFAARIAPRKLITSMVSRQQRRKIYDK